MLVERNPSVPLVSIIIPTYNSSRTIAQCLESIQNQTYKKLETIIVDRHSTDKTLQIARKFKAQVYTQNTERSEAKNFGCKKARGEFVFFIDSDMELAPKVVEECVRLCVDRKFDAVMVLEKTVASGFLAKCRKLERELYDTDPNFFLMPRFFRKDTFLELHGFDEDLFCGEDFDLARRCECHGYRIGMAASPIKHLEGKVYLKRVVLKAYYYGQSLIPFFSKKPMLVLRGYSPTRFFWNVKRLIKQPACLIGIFTLKLFEYAAYLFGAFAYILEKTLLQEANR
jgi:glycosyltransferase involved in cell wall biosynthesis